MDQLTERVAEFRKHRETLRREHIASAKDVKHQVRNALKSEKKQLFSKNSFLLTLFLITALAVVAAQIWWLVLGQEPDPVRPIQSDTFDPRYSDALASPTADQLEERISSLTGNMQALSGLLTNMESKLIATDKLEERISGLTEKMGTLNSLTTDLESRQMKVDKLEERISGLTEKMGTLNSLTTDLDSRQVAADKLEERISGLSANMEKLNGLTTDLESRQMAATRLEERIASITKELQMLSDMAAGLDIKQLATLATTTTVVPTTQKPASRTNPELPTVAKVAPAIAPKWTAIPATPDPKPVVAAQPATQQISRAVPQESMASSVSEQPADSGPPKLVASIQSADSKPTNGPWIINLISSQDEAYAVRFSNTAQSKGIPTELQQATVKGTAYWRVQVTGFSTQGEASASADTIKDKLGLQDIWIMKR